MSIIDKAIEKLKDEAASDDTLQSRTGTDSEESSAPPKKQQKQSNNKKLRLDIESISAAGIVAPTSDTPHLAEEFRRIKRPLLNNAFGRQASTIDRGNLIMVTSSLPGEGKTLTALNLALSIALERDRTVLLVDADVTMSKITRMLELEGQTGLIDVLKDPDVDLGKAIINTDFPSLSVLPSGESHSHTAELLASQRMENCVRELADRYSDRVIIFDSPPLLATSESSVLASLMGQVVLVIEANKTKKNTVNEAVALLDKQKPIGVILNKTEKMPGYGYYGSYYGHA